MGICVAESLDHKAQLATLCNWLTPFLLYRFASCRQLTHQTVPQQRWPRISLTQSPLHQVAQQRQWRQHLLMPPLVKSKPTSLSQPAPKQGRLTTVLTPVLRDTTSEVDETAVDSSVARPEALAELEDTNTAAPLLTTITEDEALWLSPCVALDSPGCEPARGCVSRPHTAPALPSVPP
jgi:hypothetical protein